MSAWVFRLNVRLGREKNGYRLNQVWTRLTLTSAAWMISIFQLMNLFRSTQTERNLRWRSKILMR